MKKQLICLLGLIIANFVAVCSVSSEDWPQWRYDTNRSNASDNALPSGFSILWEKRFTPRVQVWDDPLNLDLMTFDKQFEPIVLDGKIFVAFNDESKLMAFDLLTGKYLWTFFAEGPIRFAPVGWNQKLFVVSDDGFLYSLNATDGSLLWKYSPAPNSQKVIGNRRVISAWPARGGPTVRDNTVYFASSIWPFMGTFVCALDAETGSVKWINDSTGSQYIKQPHSAPAFAGVAPQGFLVATDKYLIVPGGRSVPAVFDRATGQLKYFEINAGGKGTGGAFVSADKEHFYVHTRVKGTRAFDLETGLKTAFVPNEPVITDKLIYSAEQKGERKVIRIYQANLSSDKEREVLGEIEADGTQDLLLVKDHLVAAGLHAMQIIRLQPNDAGLSVKGEVVQTIPSRYPISRVVVANQTLVVVDELGGITAFGLGAASELATSSEKDFTIAELTSERISSAQLDERQNMHRLLSRCDAQGYAYWFGECSKEQLAAICEVTPFEQWSIVVPTSSNVDDLRRQVELFQRGNKISLFRANAQEFRGPQYTGNLVVVSDGLIKDGKQEVLRFVYPTVRPYGGAMIVPATDNIEPLADAIRSLNLEQADVQIADFGVIVYRNGKLPGAADWTHQYGDIANSIKSNDSRVKLPLGILWFGASSNLDVLPRHGHGPPEQVVGGRLFIEGMNSLSARDVYTGRVLWKRNFDNLGTYDVYYDATYEDTPLDPKYNQVHIPGANGRGTNYVVTEERIYLVVGDTCKIIDPQSGSDLSEIRLPPNSDGDTSEWGFIGVYNDVLIGGIGFAKYRDRHGLEFEDEKSIKASKTGFGAKSLDRAASLGLVGFNRFTGDLLWRVDAKHSFWHNGIVAGDGKIFCLDKNPRRIEDAMKRRGLELPTSYRIVALDHRTGSAVWEINDKIFGTWLGFSEKHNMLLQAGASASDRLADEVGQGMAVYNAMTGKVVWQKETLKYSGPCVLHNDLIITNTNSYSESAGAFQIASGEQKMTKNPLTGKYEPWKMTRAYGCNSIIASENLLTFRSGAAGYYDLKDESGTGNFGGFRSGCTANLVVANGVLNAPDYSRTCSCSYQNQTSLALVHIPDVELWSVHADVNSKLDVRDLETLAINLGAPGDRRSDDGCLWIEYPHESGESAPFSIEFNVDAAMYRHHSSRYAEADMPWLVSSGFEGVKEMTLRLKAPGSASEKSQEEKDGSRPPAVEEAKAPDKTQIYDVELIFALPKLSESSENIFDVSMEGCDQNEHVELKSEDGLKTSVKRLLFRKVVVGDSLRIQFNTTAGKSSVSGIRLRKIKE